MEVGREREEYKENYLTKKICIFDCWDGLD